MRVGVDTGEVVVSTLGERAGHDFVAVGPTVNRAARLQCRRSRGRRPRLHRDLPAGPRAFNVRAGRPALELKGLDAPVDAYLVVSERPRGFRLDRLGVVEGIEASTVGRARRDPVPPGTLPRRRRRGALPRRRRRRGRRASARAGCCATSTSGSPGQPQVVWWFRGRASHVEQNRANSLTRDVIATRMEIAESDPPEVVREKLEAGFAMAYGDGRRRRSAPPTWSGSGSGFDLGTDAAATAGVPTEPAERARPGDRGAGPSTSRGWRRRSRSSILLEDLHWADDDLAAAPRRRRRGCGATARSWSWPPPAPPLLEDRAPLGFGASSTTSGSRWGRCRAGRAGSWSSSCCSRSTTRRRSSSTWSSTRPRATRSTSRSWSPGSSTRASSCPTAAVADRRRAGRLGSSCPRPSRACCRRASTP